MTKTVKILIAATVLFVLLASALLIAYIRRTDIHAAIRIGDTERVRAMLARRPDLIEIREDMDYSPLHTAAAEGHADIVKLLIEKQRHSGQVDSFRNTPLHIASGRGHTEVVCILLSKTAISPSAKNNQNDTPLHLAADAGHLEVARILIEAGADLNAKDYRNQTPLERATDRGRKKVADMLREHEAKEQ
jgi:ankyrin repeat protein